MAATKPHTRRLPATLLPLVLSLGLYGQWAVLPAHGETTPETGPAIAAAEDGTLSRKERRAARKREKRERQEALNRSLDWYPLEDLSEAQLANTPPYCDGAYIQPYNDNPEAGLAAERAPLRAAANDTALYQNEHAKLEGNVNLAKGDLMVHGDQATFDKVNNTLNASGNIEVREKGVLVRGDFASINVEKSTGILNNARYVLHPSHIRGAADQIEKKSANIIRLNNGSYTQCSPQNESWLMRASDITLDQERGVGSAKHARLQAGGVPVFYFPYMTFPIDNSRRTGFLFPSAGTAKSSGGLDLSVPFYWNIAPNWDATIAARYIEARGTAAELEARHLNRYSSWVVAGSWIDDQEFGDDRWFYAVTEAGLLPGGWFHNINYTEVSDRDYLTDLSGATSLEFQRTTSLVQSAGISKTGRIYTFSVQAVQYQVLDDFVIDQYRRLPQVSFNVETEANSFAPQWLLVAQGTQFDIDSKNRAVGTRVYLEPGVRLPMVNSWGHVTPTVKLKSVNYVLSEDHDLRPGVDVRDERPGTTVPMASVDAGMVFDRPTRWFGQGFTNTLEPRLYYLYNKYENQTDQPLFDTGFTTFDYNQLFRESRFTGYDRIPDANQVSVGLTTRLIQDRTGTETLWASIGQIYYFSDREVTLDQPTSTTGTAGSSQVAGELGYQWSRRLRSYVSALYDNQDNNMSQASGTFRYTSDRGYVFNLGHYYRRQSPILAPDEDGLPVLNDNPINQSDISAIVPINRHWALMGRYNYDFANTRTLGEALGVEYNACCWKLRVAYQSGLNSAFNTERGIYFQLELKGLGGTDTGVESILESSIVGFEEYEERDHF